MLNSGECCHCENWYVANHWHMQGSWLQACCHQRLAHWQFSEGSGVSPWFWGQVPAEMAWDERHDAELRYDLGMDHGGPRSIWMPTAIQAPERCPNLVSLGQERQWDNKPVKFKEPKEAKEVRSQSPHVKTQKKRRLKSGWGKGTPPSLLLMLIIGTLGEHFQFWLKPEANWCDSIGVMVVLRRSTTMTFPVPLHQCQDMPGERGMLHGV